MKLLQPVSNLLLFCVLLFATSCNTKPQSSKKWKLVQETVQYDVGFPGYFMPCQSNQKNEEYVAFVNFATYKKFAVFTTKGKHLYDVSIQQLMEQEKTDFFFGGFTGKDTFALLSKYTNRIYLIDKNARVIAKKDYSRYLLDGYEFFPKVYYKNGRIEAGVMYQDPNYPSNATVKDIAKSYHQMYGLPKWFVDPKFFDSTDFSSVQFVVDSFYTRFVKKNQFLSEGRYELNLDSLHIFYSGYTDSLYIYNKANYVLSKAIKISSNFTPKIGAKKTTFKEAKDDPNIFNVRIRNSSFINRLYFDPYRKMYYCFVRFPMKGKLLPFSIIVYDTNFNKLDEIKMDENKYSPNTFVGKKGVYILNKDNEPQNRYFSIFNYE